MAILKFEVGKTMRIIIEHIDQNAAAVLKLAKDDGIYICPVPNPSKNHALYAEGCKPFKCDSLNSRVFEHCNSLVGPDDFSEDIPLEWLRMAVDFRWRSCTSKSTMSG